MKKIKYILITIAFITVISLGFNKTVNAEEETSSATTGESELQLWVNENLPWLIGIPTGTVTTILIEFIVLAKKLKKKDEEINETKDLNSKGKIAIDATKEILESTKVLTRDLKASVNNALNQINKTDSRINTLVTDLANNMAKQLETLTTAIEAIEKRISSLEQVQEMIALHSKELVSNGTAEKISKKLKRG